MRADEVKKGREEGLKQGKYSLGAGGGQWDASSTTMEERGKLYY